jgi:hypothetical protein
MIKMNITDFLDDGLTTQEGLEVASIYAATGFDAIELSGGAGFWAMVMLGDVNRTPGRNVEEKDIIETKHSNSNIKCRHPLF